MSLRDASFTKRAAIGLMERLRRTDAAALLPGLMASQYRTAAEIATSQKAALRDHLVFCGENVPYYRDLFDRCGFDPSGSDLPGDLRKLPVITKSVIKAAGDGLHAATFAEGQPRHKCTSGSTGIPLNYYLDRRSHSYLWAHIWRAWAEAGYRPGDVYATLSGGSLLPEKVDFKQKVYLYLSGAVHLPSYHLTADLMDGYLRRVASSGIRYLYGYPSSLELFANHVAEKGVRDLPFAAVFTTSELLTPTARQSIERGLGAPVHDTYGCNDGGAYAFECREHAGWHQNMESCFVEIVDDEGSPLPDGEVGRIVTTHFANRTHPFLRYDTGDMGAIDRSPCACGRGLVRIVDIQGRQRDIVVTPTGRRVHGAFFNHFEPFYEAEWLERYQIFQPDQSRIVVRMQSRRPPTPAEESRIIAMLKSGLDDMDVELQEVPEFELTATGKFRVVISRLA